MEIKNKSLKEKAIIFGRIIFWLFVVFSFSFNFVEDILSYGQAQFSDGASLEQPAGFSQPEDSPAKNYYLK
ncbi:MAG TPA: hypothetical protein P5089_01580 [Candidatus Portnoybacteria bacterium]|nr:hypothetical protein [Candidatus Portnoybacteria bacterium]